MKIRKYLSIMLILTVILSNLIISLPSSAENNKIISYILCEDFSGEHLDAKYTNYSSTPTPLYDETTGQYYADHYAIGEGGTLKMYSVVSDSYIYFMTPKLGVPQATDKLVVSYKFKVDNLKSIVGVRQKSGRGYGLHSINAYNGNIYPVSTSSGTEIGSYALNEWVEIACVYATNSTTGFIDRDIYINGEYAATVAGTVLDYQVSDLTELKVALAYYNYNDTVCSVEYDDLRIYKEASEMAFKIESASTNKIVVNTNMIPDSATVIPSNFVITDGTTDITPKTAKIGEGHTQIELELDTALLPGTEYTLKISGLTAGMNASSVGNKYILSEKEIAFETPPLKICAENLKLYDVNGSEVTALADGTYKVKTSLVNESSDTLSPYIAAGLYDENKELKSLQLIPASDDGNPIEKDITLSGTSGLTLKLFMIKGLTTPETISAVSEYTAQGAVTDGAFNSEIKILRDSFNIETVVNSDTQVITTGVESFAENMARPATLIVLKDGKTLSQIDAGNPMATIVAFDSANNTAGGFSYKIADVKSNYEAYLYLTNSDNHGYKAFMYYGKAFMDAGLDTVKDITAGEVVSFIGAYKDVINLDTTAYDLMSPEEQELVHASIEAQREEKGTGEYASFGEFITAFEIAVELAGVKTNSDVISLIGTLPSSTCTDLYTNTISDDAKTALYTEIINAKPLTMDEFEDVFETYVILKGNEKAESYTQTQAIIENTTAITGIDLSVYDTVNDKKTVNTAITKKSYASLSLLKAAFDTAVTNQKASETVIIIPPQQGSTPSYTGGGSTSVSSPMEKTEISIEPESTETPVVPVVTSFTDLEGFDWAKDAVYNLKNKGIINGVSETSYNPSGEVKREEFVKMIATLYSGENIACAFSDVNQSEWYAPYVNKAVTAGIIKGMNEETFGLGLGVTREDMAVMIVRALKLEAIVSDAVFSDDSEIADYAKEAVYTLKNKGIISGTGNGSYEPKRVMTRAEAAVLINNILNIVD